MWRACIARIPCEIQSVVIVVSFSGRVIIPEAVETAVVEVLVVVVTRDPVWARAVINMVVVVEVLVIDVTDVVSDVSTRVILGANMLAAAGIVVVVAVVIPLELPVSASYSSDVLSDVAVDVLLAKLTGVVIGVVPSIGGADVEAGLNVDVFAVTITALKFARPAPLGELSC